MKKINLFRISKYFFDSKLLSGLISVKRYQQLSKLFLRTIWVVGGRISKLNHNLSLTFAKKVISVHKHHGFKGLVKFLKACSVLTQQSLGGYIIPDSGLVDFRLARSKSGFPRFLPVHIRQCLIRKDQVLSRFVLTLFSLYRVLNFPGKLKLGTITSGFTGFNHSFIEKYTKNFHSVFMQGKVFDFGSNSPFILRTGSATTSKDVLAYDPISLIRAFIALKSEPSVGRSLEKIISLYGVSSAVEVRDLFKYYTSKYNKLIEPEILENKEGLLNIRNSSSKFLKNSDGTLTEVMGKSQLYSGKLAILEEPAGKVRVFAMPEIFTQWALKPVHDFIFNKILRPCKMDGTFDQTGPLKRVPFGKAPIYSYDLSAATDRLPMDVQVSLMSTFTNSTFAKNWSKTLTERSWKTPSLKQLTEKNISYPEPYPGSVKYAVGQPMGAYSSWAMLALTHHFIVQVSAWYSGVTPKNKIFEDYALLGDDFVIWNKTVASTYLFVLSSLGVECGLHKSIVSLKGTCLEFAKRTIVNGTDYSPVTFRDMSVASERLTNFTAFINKMSMTPLSALRFLGYGYKVGPDKISSRIVRLMNLSFIIPKTFSELIDFYQLTLDRLGTNLQSNSLKMRFRVYRALLVEIERDSYRLFLRSKSMEADLRNHKDEISDFPISPLHSWSYFKEVIPYFVKINELKRAISKINTLKGKFDDLSRSLRVIIKTDFPIDTKYFDPLDYPHYTGLWNSKSDIIRLIISSYFSNLKAFKSLSSESIVNVVRKSSEEYHVNFSEEKHTLILWNTWLRRLQKSKLGTKEIMNLVVMKRKKLGLKP